jgi:hypothetical protein
VPRQCATRRCGTTRRHWRWRGIGEPQLMFPCWKAWRPCFLDRGRRRPRRVLLHQADEVCAKAGVDRDSLVVLPFLC